MDSFRPPIVHYTHYQAGHCESGGVASLLSNYGMALSEPMAFGVSSCIMFAYFPFLRLWEMPFFSFRMPLGYTIKGVQRALGVRFRTRTYQDEDEAMAELDRLLDEGKPVGARVSASFLPYLLENINGPLIPVLDMHNNGHMVIIYGRQDDTYLVSDPVCEHATTVKRDEMRKARFAKGSNPPRGNLFYPDHIPSLVDYRAAVRRATRKTSRMMLQPLLPYVGVKAIHAMARRIERLGQCGNPRFVRRFLGNIIMVQEVMGTAGAGFRFIYAAFLKEAGDLLDLPALRDASRRMLAVGDLWQEFAYHCVKVVKGPLTPTDTRPIAAALRRCGDEERQVYLMLRRMQWG